MPARSSSPASLEEVLAELERKVREAAGRLSTLREENLSLKQRIADLEAAGAGRWADERDQIRQRVEALTRQLEALASSSPDQPE